MLISYDEIINIFKKYNIEISHVLHIGAHECEELNFYNKCGIKNENIIWIDALEEKVKKNINRGIKNVYHATITDEDDKIITFNITNNFQSSSIYKFGTHSKEHPNVKFVKNIKQKSITLNTFFEKNQIDGTQFDFWNFDIQGAELVALKGGNKYIQYAKAIYLEVNEKELYLNCGLISDIDNFLSQYKFVRVITKMTKYGWGDALYIKNEN
jgi:FkbM family methyltransferase